MLTFNLSRVKALFVREFYLGYLPMLRASSIVILVLFVINFIRSTMDKQENNSGDFSDTIIQFGLILLIGGFMYASVAFKEFGTVSTRAEYLALPGSSLEKLTVKWFVTNPLFILTISLLMLFTAGILSPFFEVMLNPYESNEVIEIHTDDISFFRQYWNLVGIYFILHSIFFFGSIAFNRIAIIKTLVAVILVTLIVALLNVLWFRIVFADQFDAVFHIKDIAGSRMFGDQSSSPTEMWQIQFFIFAFKYLLAPIIWVASLFKLSEKEV